MKHQRKITIPTSPWDVIEDPLPMPINPPKIVDKAARKLAAKPVEKAPLTPASARTPIQLMATRCFVGNLNASDMKYMALALLQVQDEVFELRERVRILEGLLPDVDHSTVLQGAQKARGQ